MKSRHELEELMEAASSPPGEDREGSLTSICNVPRRLERPSGRVIRREGRSGVVWEFIGFQKYSVFSVQYSVGVASKGGQPAVHRFVLLFFEVLSLLTSSPTMKLFRQRVVILFNP